MILHKSNPHYKVYQVDSKSELEELCRNKQAEILGFEIENARNFYLIYFQYQNTERFYGLIHGGHGIEPTVTKIEKSDLAVISSDQFIYLVNLNETKNITRIDCESIVYDFFLYHDNPSRVIAISELGVRCFTLSGSLIWRYDCDTLHDFFIFEDYIEISTDNGKDKLSLKDGSLL